MNDIANFKKIVATFFTLIVLSSVLSIGVTFLINEKNLLPKKYLIQSQVYVTPKNEDNTKKEDYLKYNEDYSVLLYSPKFLSELLSETDFKTITDLKNHIKVIYTNTSHIITLQHVVDNKKKGLELADIILSKFNIQASEIVKYNKLTILSEPCVVQEIRYSNTLILLLLDLFFFCLLSLIYLIYIKKFFTLKNDIYG